MFKNNKFVLLSFIPELEMHNIYTMAKPFSPLIRKKTRKIYCSGGTLQLNAWPSQN
jgi:hypothetical protein